MLNIYLTGSISKYYELGQLNKAKDWRIKASNYIITNIDNCFIFDPTENFEKNLSYNPKGIVYQNLNYLKKTDLLLLNLEYLEDSPGSLFELYYAFFNHIPVIAFGKSNKNIDLQAHVKESLTICFDNIDDALDYLLYMYSQQ